MPEQIMTDAPPAECFTCGKPVICAGSPGHMCDKNTTEGRIWCSECFSRKPCGMGEHGEGCPTSLHSDQPAPAAVEQEEEPPKYGEVEYTDGAGLMPVNK